MLARSAAIASSAHGLVAACGSGIRGAATIIISASIHVSTDRTTAAVSLREFNEIPINSICSCFRDCGLFLSVFECDLIKFIVCCQTPYITIIEAELVVDFLKSATATLCDVSGPVGLCVRAVETVHSDLSIEDIAPFGPTEMVTSIKIKVNGVCSRL